MAEPFKLLLDERVVRALGHHLQRAWAKFPRARFEAQALAGLDALELKARALHIAAALSQALPKSFDAAAGVMEAALARQLERRAVNRCRVSPDQLAQPLCAAGELAVVARARGRDLG